PEQPSAVVPERHLFLDVVVSASAGRPISGLEPRDFKLLDNDRPAKMLSFHWFGGAAALPDPPVEVILLIDELNLSFVQVSFVKSQIAEFLGQNGGRLEQPV